MEYSGLEQEISLLHERICSALDDTTRIMILYLLSENALFVNEISDKLNLPQPTVSRHLKVLRERNLVATERQGTAIQYSLTDSQIIHALDLMRNILARQIKEQAAITGSFQELNETI